MSKNKLMATTLVLVMSLVVMVITPGYSAEKTIGLLGSLGLPQSQNNFSDLYGTGFGFGLEYKRNLINKTNLVLGFSHTIYAEDTEALASFYRDVMQANCNARWWLTTQAKIGSAAATGGGLAVQTFSAAISQYLINSEVGVYLVAGPGLYLYRWDELTVTAPRTVYDPAKDTTTELEETLKRRESVKFVPAFFGGLGLEFNVLSNISLFVEGKYSYVRNPREGSGSYGNIITGVGGVRYSF